MFTLRKFYFKQMHGLQPHHVDEFGAPIVPKRIPGNTKSIIFLRSLNAIMLILAVTFSTHNHWISPVSTVPYNPVAFNTTEDDEEAGLPVPNPWKEMGDASNVAIIGKAFIILSETLILSFTLIMIVHRLIVLDSANRTAEFLMFLVASIVLLFAACLECWYATGFTYMDREGIDYTIWGWISAAIWLLIAALIAFVDALVTKWNLSILDTKVKQIIQSNSFGPNVIEDDKVALHFEQEELMVQH